MAIQAGPGHAGFAKFEWEIKPSQQIVPNLEAYRKAVLAAVRMTFEAIARKVRSYAVTNRTWIDRTGTARSGLRTQVAVMGAVATLTLYHTAEYGIWLEVANAGKYAIILKTMTAHFPMLMQMLNDVLSGVSL
jgi:hypothetical protein